MWISKTEKGLLEKTIGILEQNLKDLQEKNQYLTKMVCGDSGIPMEMIVPDEPDMEFEETELLAGTILEEGATTDGGNRQDD